MTTDEKRLILINVAAQKIVTIAALAMNMQLQGYDALTEFCELTHLQGIVDRLRNGELSLGNLEEITELLSEIGEKTPLSYLPVLEQLVVEVKAESFQEIGQINSNIVDLTIQVNHEPPTLFLTPLGFGEGLHEVGVGAVAFKVKWQANKIPLELIDFVLPDEGNRSVQNLTGTLPAVTLDFSGSEPLRKTISARYNGREPFRGKHLLSQASLNFNTVWPCYWGAGPVDALEGSSAEINLFALSLNRELECKTCVETILKAGEVLYFFYPFSGKSRQFVSENGIINNSYKGTVENFQTKSQLEKNDLGNTTYGVIRTDQPGIGLLNLCVKESEWLLETIVEVPTVPLAPINYDSIWTKISCVKEILTFDSVWSDSVCAKGNSI